jgi:predicted MFS family arabinose efflux permease
VSERSVPGTGEQVATRIAFFIAGFSMSAWAPLVPFAKARAELSEAALGLLLLCIGIGSLIAMPLTGVLTGRLGCRKVIISAGILACIALPFTATMSTVPLLAIALLLLGAAVGTMDVAMNIQAVIVEKASGRSLMSGFHALYSVGGIAGAGGVSGFLWLGLSPVDATLAVIAIVVVLLIISSRNLLTYGSDGGVHSFVLPYGPVIFIGALCFIVFLAEGAMLDWSAVFLTSLRGVSPEQSGMGYAAFAIAMTLGRLTGDRIVDALGGRKVLFFGGLLAGAGFILTILTPFWIVSLLGFVVIGLGCSNIVPVLFTAAGRQTRMPPNLAVAAISTLGYAGVLAGPAGIGFVAQSTSLPTAFAIVAISLLFVAVSARRVPVASS